MKTFEIDYFDHKTEMIKTLIFEAPLEDIDWQMRDNANKFFVVDTPGLYFTKRMEDVKRIDIIPDKANKGGRQQ